MRRRIFLNGLAGVSISSFSALAGCSPSAPERVTTSGSVKRRLKPQLDNDWWLIGPPPEPDDALRAMPVRSEEEILAEIDRHWAGWGLEPSYAKERAKANAGKARAFEGVDHHILKGSDGYYHLWGCLRNTASGRVLYHWRSKTITDTPWEPTGDVLRCSPNAGECVDDWMGQEWMQSPYFIESGGEYFMFYGGHSTGVDISGAPASGSSERMFASQSQICLMTSKDGVNWTRYEDEQGYSRVFVGPGEARDPCLINIDGLWHCYYAGYEGDDPHTSGGVYVRTSKDLYSWSDYTLVHRHTASGEHQWLFECPHVVYRDGYFYLFRTENYYEASSHVYRSENPLDFGATNEDAEKLYVGPIACAAPEIYQWDGAEYLSSNHDPALGTQLCRLKWVEDVA